MFRKIFHYLRGTPQTIEVYTHLPFFWNMKILVDFYFSFSTSTLFFSLYFCKLEGYGNNSFQNQNIYQHVCFFLCTFFLIGKVELYNIIELYSYYFIQPVIQLFKSKFTALKKIGILLFRPQFFPYKKIHQLRVNLKYPYPEPQYFPRVLFWAMILLFCWCLQILFLLDHNLF